MGSDVVYIPTLSRLDLLERVVPFWLQQEMQVRLIVERHEYAAHQTLKKRMKWGGNVYILPLKLAGRGIGYARRECVLHAHATHLKSVIMSDDDMYPHPDTDVWELIDEAERPGVLGIGATRSLHDRFTNGAISRNHGVILCPGGWGLQLFGLNIQEAISCGNFDHRLHTIGEDAELARQGIARGIPWLVHCDVKAVAAGKRYAPGGFSAKYKLLEARREAEKVCMEIIHRRWPDYTNPPEKPLRMMWQKMLSNYIPEWRDYSALHGGDIKNLRNKHFTP
jgi:hypothetical protein